LNMVDRQLSQFAKLTPPVYEKLIIWQKHLLSLKEGIDKDLSEQETTNSNLKIAGFDFDKDDPLWEEGVIEEVFNLMEEKGALFPNDKTNFSNACLGEEIDKPILWRFTSGNTKNGDQGALKNFLVILFNGYDKGIMKRAKALFIDASRTHFLNPESGYSKTGIIFNRGIDKELQVILDKGNTKVEKPRPE